MSHIPWFLERYSGDLEKPDVCTKLRKQDSDLMLLFSHTDHQQHHWNYQTVPSNEVWKTEIRIHTYSQAWQTDFNDVKCKMPSSVIFTVHISPVQVLQMYFKIYILCLHIPINYSTLHSSVRFIILLYHWGLETEEL